MNVRDRILRNARDGFGRRDGSVWYIGFSVDLPGQAQDPLEGVYLYRCKSPSTSAF